MNAETKIETPTLAKALVQALSEISGVAKGKTNPAFKSKYVDLSSVLDAIRPVFANHGLAVTQETSPSEDGVIVETVVLHFSGEERRFGKLYIPANKRDAQGAGSALTYARRYSLMTAFGVPAEDDDGNAAARFTPPKAEPVGQLRDDQFALISALATAANKPVKVICEAYKVGSIAELTEAQATAVIARLKAAAPVKEDA